MKWISAVNADNSANGECKHYFLDYCQKNNRFDKFFGLYIDRKNFGKLWSIYTNQNTSFYHKDRLQLKEVLV